MLSECLHDLEYSRSRPLGLAVSGQINTQFSYLLLSHSLLNKVMGHNSKGKSCPLLLSGKEEKKGKRREEIALLKLLLGTWERVLTSMESGAYRGE